MEQINALLLYLAVVGVIGGIGVAVALAFGDTPPT